jgi:hypothetical protein
MKVRSKRQPTEQDPSHQAIEVAEVTYCGSSWCNGSCGIPALVVKYESEGLDTREARAMGSAVACGPVFQSFRTAWIGEKVYYEPRDEEERTALFKLMWW